LNLASSKLPKETKTNLLWTRGPGKYLPICFSVPFEALSKTELVWFVVAKKTPYGVSMLFFGKLPTGKYLPIIPTNLSKIKQNIQKQYINP